MQTIDAGGRPLGLALFIQAFKAAKKLSPARFLTLRIHPRTFAELNELHKDVTEIVQVGEMVGHLGKKVTRIACVPAPNGLGDGVIVNKDSECEQSRFEFQIHGATELEVVNLAATHPQCSDGTVSPPSLPIEWPSTVQ